MNITETPTSRISHFSRFAPSPDPPPLLASCSLTALHGPSTRSSIRHLFSVSAFSSVRWNVEKYNACTTARAYKYPNKSSFWDPHIFTDLREGFNFKLREEMRNEPSHRRREQHTEQAVLLSAKLLVLRQYTVVLHTELPLEVNYRAPTTVNAQQA